MAVVFEIVYGGVVLEISCRHPVLVLEINGLASLIFMSHLYCIC